MALPHPAAPPSVWLGLPAAVVVVLATSAIKLAIGAHSGLVFDEGYYAFWSQRLAVGYLDHPPAVAWLIALGQALFGANELGVRAMAVACEMGVAAAAYRIGVLLFDRRAAALAVIWFSVTPLAGIGFLMTPDPPSVLCWTATLWAVAEFMHSRNANWWLAAGVLAGLGLWSKYTLAFLALGLLLLILTSRERRQWLLVWQVWAGALLALVVFAPVIWWNAGRDWASFRFQGQRTVVQGIDGNWLGNLGDLLLSQSLLVGPVLVGLSFVGIALLLTRPGAATRQGLALPVWTSLPAVGYFLFHTLHGQVDGNWPAPLWPALTLPAAAIVTGLLDRRRGRPFALLLSGLQIVLGLAATGLIYTQLLYQPFALGAYDRTGDTRGWAGVERTVGELARANGAKWVATIHDYGVTGLLATYGRFAHDPLPVRQIDEPQRWEFLPLDPAALGWPALLVRQEPTPDAPQPPSALFGDFKLVGTFRRDGGKAPLEAYSAFLVSAPTPAFLAGLKP